MNKVRYCYGDQFKVLNDKALKLGRNRSVDPVYLADTVTDDQPLICQFAMPHEHQAGVLTDPHVRTLWVARDHVNPGEENMQFILDVEIEDFDALPVHEHHSDREEAA